MPLKLGKDVVGQWVALAEGKFNIRDICQDLGIESPENKAYLRVIMARMVEEKIVARLTNYGDFRKVDGYLEPIMWQDADPANIVPLEWPFEIEKYALMYPKNVAIVAGSKQEGKTTFLYEFIKRNMYNYAGKLDLFNSETGAEQMHDRFAELGIPFDAPFMAYERYDNFADVIDPTHVSVIDYLDMNSDFYLAGTEIDAIFRRLTTGVAIIGMQIPPPSVTYLKGVKKVIDRDLAYGGGTTAKRAFIYLSLSSHRLKLKYAKKPAQKNFHPENMMWEYSFDEKGQFTKINRFYGDMNDTNDTKDTQ